MAIRKQGRILQARKPPASGQNKIQSVSCMVTLYPLNLHPHLTLSPPLRPHPVSHLYNLLASHKYENLGPQLSRLGPNRSGKPTEQTSCPASRGCYLTVWMGLAGILPDLPTEWQKQKQNRTLQFFTIQAKF